MLDHFCIFTKGGVLLWAVSFAVLKGEPINALVRACLLEDRTGESSFNYTPPSGGYYALKWRLHNGLGLVFVAVYQRGLKIFYVDELLEKVSKAFAKQYRLDCHTYPDFDATFRKLLRECEAKADTSRQPTVAPVDQSDLHLGGGHNVLKQPPPTSGKELSSAPAKAEVMKLDDEGQDNIVLVQEDVGRNEQASASPEASQENKEKGAFDAALLNKKKLKKGGGVGRSTKKSELSTQSNGKKGSKHPVKQARKWDELANGAVGDAESLDKLDFTEGEQVAEVVVVQDMNKQSLVDQEEDIDLEELDENGDERSGGLLSSFVRTVGVNMVGTASLREEDLKPALLDMKKKLMERNVAEEIAEKVIDSVSTSLEGKRLGSFTRISTVVRSAVEEALTRILTPKRSIDILREVKNAKTRERPYVIVFVGVNGVGKSTNLAKVAYWLGQNGARVLIAACDTFRSGAVEQLKTHCARLSVPLYERGYEKDPAKVAFEAVKAAQKEGRDVVLVDTAGRMQDNEPLMRALSNLINVNQPDLVLFVGEALVGNDAVDQLTKFNRRLADLAPGHEPHLIDGIVLTKFDTIDDKVGAALSMVYTSGAPIMFVGCGQTYVDLKRLNIKSVVASLLK